MGKIALFGASGKTGLHLVRKLVAARHPVSCLVRNAVKLQRGLGEGAFAAGTSPAGALLEVEEGCITDATAVARCVDGAAVVVVALGGPPKGPGVDICSKAQAVINAAVLGAHDHPLVVVVSSIGVGDHYAHCSLFAKAFASLLIPEALRDKDVQERSVREALTHWIVVRPGGLTDGPATGSWTAAPDACGWFPAIAREDLAQFLLAECVEPGLASRWLGKNVAVV